MLCLKCGATLTERDYCAKCGTDVKIYKKIIRLSNSYYNEGLAKANVRDLSGAVQDLQYSLKINKKNIPARNLLGLVYFEIGEVVSALTEWIISKNLEPRKNIADEYIQAVQDNPARLDTINQTIKKYNQSLLYCNQGSEDLAIIQLKKVLSLNPKLVKAHQLLALLYIKTEEYDRAGRELKRALAIDKTDNTSLRYLKELDEITGSAGKGVVRANKRTESSDDTNPDLISYTSGNETIIMPKPYKENAGGNILMNIMIGLVVGVALMWFLVVPAKIKSAKSDANQQIVEYSNQISAKQATIDSLTKELEDLNSVEDGEGNTVEKDAVIASYEKLAEAIASRDAGDDEAAATALEEVDASLLSETAKGIYDSIYAAVNVGAMKEFFDTGSVEYSAKNYETAIENLQKVVDVDESYENGYAIYYLARSYEAVGEKEKAITYYNKFIELLPDTERAAYAASYLAQLQQ